MQGYKAVETGCNVLQNVLAAVLLSPVETGCVVWTA